MNWILKKFDQLTTQELHDILKLRQDIFIIEQTCIYPDIDGVDTTAYHYFAYNAEDLVAYTRILAPEIKYKEASIGRIVISQSRRSTGLGEKLVANSIIECNKLYKSVDIRIEAQAHLEKFYNDLGFKSVGGIYLADGIDHVQMVYSH